METAELNYRKIAKKPQKTPKQTNNESKTVKQQQKIPTQTYTYTLVLHVHLSPPITANASHITSFEQHYYFIKYIYVL